MLLPDLAEQLGLRYHEYYQIVRRLGLELEKDPAIGQYEVTPDEMTIVHAECERIRSLHERSMKLAAAARELDIALSIAAILSGKGEIEVDRETDSSGARYVTRASVTAYEVERRLATRPNSEAVGAVPLREAARITGTTIAEVMDLVKEGALEQRPGRQACVLTIDSLRSWDPRRFPYDEKERSASKTG
jgi:hypothetical protein